ncbi:hypothetical protein [Arthrobacter sp. UYCo732]|uniref:hypothetical protein n=1 Tax=Arthrobacter sp. UYCo732 TaxID=3156336 RepID=UPI00339675C9
MSPEPVSAHITAMTAPTTQLTVRQLIDALSAIPDNPLVIIAGFGTANVPGNLRRHRAHLPDVGIEVVYDRMNSVTVNRLTFMLHQHATQPVSKFNPNPTTLDSPVWIRPSMEHEKSFFAVTRVDSFKGHAVIRAENVAPVQGPSIQRVSDEELLRRNSEFTRSPDKEPNLDVESPVNRWIFRAMPTERTAARLRLETARADLEKLVAEIPQLEAECAQFDYVLGVTDTPPVSERPAAGA